MKKINFWTWIDWLILLVIWIAILVALVQSLSTDNILYPQYYIGVGACLVTTALLYLNPKVGKYSLAVLLVFGSTNLIMFTMSSDLISYSLSLGNSKMNSIGIQLLSFILLLIFLIAHRKSVIEAIIKMISETPEEKEQKRRQEIAHYKKLFQDCSLTKLEQLIKFKDEYNPAARNVLYNLLDEKRSKQKK